MASLWTGLFPPRSGVTRFDHVLPEAAELPAEMLAKAGFQTIGIYRNGWVAPTFGFGQGYDVYQRPSPRPVPATVKLANPTIKERGTDEDAVEAAFEFLRVAGRKRWYLYLHLMDVHEYLYDEESALFGTDHPDIYDNAIRHTDSVIDVLLEGVADAGYLDKTVVVIAADHGEAFGERGFDGHAREVYRETTEVPFLIAFPFRLESGVTVHATTRNVDVWPTVLDLLGLAMPEGVDGRSLVPEILALARGDQSAVADRTGFAHIDQTWGQPSLAPKPAVAVVEEGHRYVRVEQGSRVVEQLFDSREDPDELRDRAREQPELVARLRERAEQQLTTSAPWGDTPTRELGELELNHLRALGYALP